MYSHCRTASQLAPATPNRYNLGLSFLLGGALVQPPASLGKQPSPAPPARPDTAFLGFCLLAGFSAPRTLPARVREKARRAGW